MASFFLQRRAQWTAFRENHYYLDLVLSSITYYLPPVNYITVHYTYFLVLTFLSSIVFYLSSPSPTSASIYGSTTAPFNATRISYTDSLFMVTSALTTTGLNTVNLGVVSTWQQVILWGLMIIGSPIWISLWTVLARKRAFEHRFEAIVENERETRRLRRQRAGGRLGRAANLARVASMGPKKSEPRSVSGDTADSEDQDGTGSAARGRVVEMTPLEAPSTLSREATVVPAEPLPQEPHRPSLKADSGTKNDRFGEHQCEKPQIATRSASSPPPHHEPTSPPDHISILLPTDTRDSRNRPDSPASSASSLDVTDFLFHWDQILTKNKVSHNSQFHGLTSEQRENIGGCEYRALKVLALTVPLYFVLWQLLCGLALGAWMSRYGTQRSEAVGASPWWTGIFLAVSAFNNGGLAIFSDSLVSFGRSYFVLGVAGLLILVGNTAYPILLRLIFWSTLKLLELFKRHDEDYAVWRETLGFMLQYPRRVYTTMFPAQATWWLAGVLVVINSIDWVLFEVLNIGNDQLESLPMSQRILDGCFQSISVRAAGLVVFPLGNLYISMQVVQLVMMYISVYPVVITMRSSNVYEERSLGIYADDSSAAPAEQSQSPQPVAAACEDTQTILPSANPHVLQSSAEPNKGQFLRRRKTSAVIQGGVKRAFTFHGVGVAPPPSPSASTGSGAARTQTSFVTQQIRGQLAHDLWWLVLAILVIVIIEAPNFRRDPLAYSVFNIIFECVSAYGCVGLSIGFSGIDPSFSAAMSTGSKIVMVGVMLRGRHRGLPVAVDRAVRLPGEKLAREEEADGRARRAWSERRSMESRG